MPPDLRSLRILFVTAASNAIGFGHLNRCLALAAYGHARHADVSFLVFGGKTAQERINEAGYACLLLDESCLDVNASDWPGATDLYADVVIADLIYPAFPAACADPEALFQRLHALGRLRVALDVLGDFSIAGKLRQIAVDLVVVPYAAAPMPARPARWRLLNGAAYALLSPEYAGLPHREPQQQAKRILVSCGGSDPRGYTAEVLRGLEFVDRHLEVVVVVGPFFSAALRGETAKLAEASRHDVRIVDAPRTLLDDMLWCDLAISASGLTKYELAASGTPALLFSIDTFHDGVNRSFAAEGTAIDLGEGVSAEVVADETIRLLDDAALRRKLAAAGRKLVDGMGTQRLFTEIKKELSC